MNHDELHDTLSALAGAPPPATPAARSAVANRVRRARRRLGALTTVAVIIAAVGTAGIVQSAASDGGSDSAVVARGVARCRQLPRPVPRAQVPPEVRAWAGNRAVVGGGALWTVRRNLAQRGVREGPIHRLKLGWLVLPAVRGGPAPTLTGREVDGTRRAVGEVGEAFDQHGRWFASTIEVTGPRACWQITARLGADAITFRRPLRG